MFIYFEMYLFVYTIYMNLTPGGPHINVEGPHRNEHRSMLTIA